MENEIFGDFEKNLLVKSSELSEEDKINQEYADRINRWKKKRIGKITSSNLDSLMNLKRDGKMGEKGINYILETIHQIQTGCDSEEVFAKAFEWGHAYEEEALEYYNKVTGNDVKSGTYGFDDIVFVDDIIDGFGDSPDGITEDRTGVVEIKCPYNGANHLRTFAIKEYHDKCDYFWQCMGHFVDPRVQWVDLVFYDPRYKDWHKNKINIFHLEREKYQVCIDKLIFNINRLIYLINVIKSNGIDNKLLEEI